MRGDFGSNREALQPGKLLVHGAANGARNNLLKLRANRRRQRGCEMFDNSFGAFFRRHGKRLPARSTVWASEIWHHAGFALSCHRSRKKNSKGTRTVFEVSTFQVLPSLTNVSANAVSPIGTRYVTVLVLASSAALLERTTGIISMMEPYR